MRLGGVARRGRLPADSARKSPSKKWSVAPGCRGGQGTLSLAHLVTHPPAPYRPLLAGRPGAGSALFQSAETELLQAGSRRGAGVLARRVSLLSLWAARVGGRPPGPGLVPVSRGWRSCTWEVGRELPKPWSLSFFVYAEGWMVSTSIMEELNAGPCAQVGVRDQMPMAVSSFQAERVFLGEPPGE